MKNRQSDLTKTVRRKLAVKNPEYKQEIMLGAWDQSAGFASVKAEVIDGLLNQMSRSRKQ